MKGFSKFVKQTFTDVINQPGQKPGFRNVIPVYPPKQIYCFSG